MTLWPTLLTAGLILFALVSTLAAETLAGNPEILDGDTVCTLYGSVNESALKAWMLPKRGNTALTRWANRYNCGQSAKEALKAFIGSRPVRCEGSERGRYGRMLAVCFDADGIDLNGWLVSQGWALAYRIYSRQYIPQEEAARKARGGIWAGRFTKPWQWRRGKRLE